MKKIILFALIFLSFSSFRAQILDSYPSDKDFYEGGLPKLYSDIHEIIQNHKLAPCTGSKEVYEATLLLQKDGRIKFVKDFDTANVAKNKCAYDLTLTLLKELQNKNWKPAVVKDKSFDSVVRFSIVPDHLFEKYKPGYNPYQYYVPAIYQVGKKKFASDLHDTFMSIFEDYHVNGSFYLDYVIDEKGKIVNPVLQPDVRNMTFTNEIFRTIKRMEKKWSPAYLDGTPVKSRRSEILNFSVNFQSR